MDQLVVDVVMQTLEDVYKAGSKCWYLPHGEDRDAKVGVGDWLFLICPILLTC